MRAKALSILVFLIIALNAYALSPADVNKDQVLTNAILDSGIKIIDIRTEPEWKETGVVKGAYTIMFYDQKKNVDLNTFTAELDKIVNKDEPFALLCRTSKRTGKAAKILRELGYTKVVDLKGGIVEASKHGVELVPYSSN